MPRLFWLGLILMSVEVAGAAPAQCIQANCIYIPFATRAPAANSAGLVWEMAAKGPVPRSEGQGAVVGNKLYVFGGYTDGTFIPTSRRADVYNPATNTWNRLPDLPYPITHAGTAVDGQNIYLAGGVIGTNTGGKVNATNAVWKYAVDQATWTALPPLPEPRGAGELALVGRELHFVGGTGIDRYSSEADHWVLNVDNGTAWTVAAPLPNPRNHFADAVINGKLYIIGGQHGHNETLNVQASVHVWDPAQPNEWREVAPLPRGRSHIGSATLEFNGQIYVFGGEIAHNKPVPDVSVYNPATNQWTNVAELPIARHSGIAGVMGGNFFYTSGGLNTATFKATMYR